MKQFYPVAFFDHVMVLESTSAWHWLSFPPFNMLQNGAWAVSVFFVLSGYVLSLKLIQAETFTGRQMVWMSIGRYLRLALPVVASLLLVSAILAIDGVKLMSMLSQNGEVMANPYPGDLGLVGALEYGFIHSMLLGRSEFNPVLWTMLPEFYASLGIFILAPIIGCCRRERVGPLVYVCIYVALLALLAKTIFLGFLLGMALCHLHQEPQIEKRLKEYAQYWVPAAWIIGVYLCGYMVRGLYEGAYAWITIGGFDRFDEYLYNAWGALFILAAVLYSPRVQRALQVPPVIALGEISFSLYLTHFVVLSSFGATIYLHSPLQNHSLSAAVSSCLSLLACLVVATVFHRLINEPVVKISRNISRLGQAVYQNKNEEVLQKAI